MTYTVPPALYLASTAFISPDENYRYTLHRQWEPNPKNAVWIGLNPSTADANKDDATIRKIVYFSKREGCGSMTMLNRFAFRARDPKKLLEVEDPIGVLNHAMSRPLIEGAHLLVAAWGAFAIAKEYPYVEADYQCLGHNKDGSPKHPLYLGNDTPFEKWKGYNYGSRS